MREAERLEAEHEAVLAYAEAEGLDPDAPETREAWLEAWQDHLEARAEAIAEDRANGYY